MAASLVHLSSDPTTEHTAVFFTAQILATRRGVDVVYLPVDGCGRVRARDVTAAVEARDGPQKRGLVSLMYVSNETGLVHNLPAIAAALRTTRAGREGRVLFHTDAVQAPGHVRTLDVQALGVDFLSVSAHKFHGPMGIGFLYQRDPTVLRPLWFGGHQQGGLRPGTEMVTLARALADALEDAVVDEARQAARWQALTRMSDALWRALGPFVVSGLVLPTGPPAGSADRAPHHVSFCVRGRHRQEITARLEAAGVLASGGSACSSGSSLPSHVLAAMAVPPEYIHGSVRFTFSHTNDPAEVEERVVPVVVALLRALHAESSSSPSSGAAQRR